MKNLVQLRFHYFMSDDDIRIYIPILVMWRPIPMNLSIEFFHI